MKIRRQIFFLMFFQLIILFAQNKVDSVQTDLDSAVGNEKADLLLETAGRFLELNSEKAKEYCEQALAVSSRLDYKFGIINSHYLLGKILFEEKKFVDAIDNYEKALTAISEAENDKSYASIISSISEVYLTTGVYDKALENYMNLLRFYEGNGNKKGMAFTLSFIGNAYAKLQNSQSGLKYLNEALAIAEEINDEERVSFILNSIGGLYIDVIKDFNAAEEYYKRALLLSEKINYKLGIARAYHNLGLVNYNRKDLKSALEYHKKSLEIVVKENIKEGLAYNYGSIANIYLELGDVDSAIEYFNKSLEEAQNEQIIIVISEVYKGLADSYVKKNNFKEAYKYLALHNGTREKLNNEKIGQRIAELEIQYETKRKDSENEILKRANAVQRNYFIFSVVLALVIVIILYSRYSYSKKAQKQLEELNATKDKLFSIIGHDLKNPFGTLINFSEMLMEDYLELTDEEKITYIHMINEASQTGHEILDNLLQWSKTQSGKLEFLPKKVELNEIVEANIALLKSAASHKGIEIFSAVNGGTEVFADKVMLKTVFRNLIGNAIKFSHKGGTIKIDSKSNGEFVEIVVSDNGVGMSKAAKEKLFNPTVFNSTAGTANEQGTGLGLLLCKEFVEKNGGKIWVESEEGKGSDFKFTIPIGN